MRKDQIETRYDRRSGYVPAINVKVHQAYDCVDAIVTAFSCSREDAERSANFHFESVQERFWQDAQEWATEIWQDYKPKVYSDGRSGGWLVVHGLPEVESWDARMVGRWAKLCRYCREEIAYQFRVSTILEDVEANEWAKPGAELYNFIDRKDGTTVCIADLKQQAIAAGYGPIVRR